MSDDLRRVLAAFTILAGGGDYLEIGFARGESALHVWETKRAYGLSGRVVGLDPDPQPSYEIPEGMVVVGGCSPWDIPDGPFALALIDGDHQGNAPTKDWAAVERKVTGFVVFDDVQIEGVLRASDAARMTPGWAEFWKTENCFVLRKAAG